MSGDAFVRAADRSLRETYEEPMSLAEYVDRVLETPRLASQASKYLLEAIEAAGTRTVVEEGEEKSRYRFFDDPSNDGEHAVLGNTDVLNAFVDDLQSIAAERGKAEKIIWFEGPTATGKSEFKRCLINGLREYSKTPAGRRYTIEWNVSDTEHDDRGLTYGDRVEHDEDHWFESPVRVNPLAVFPDEVKAELVEELNALEPSSIPIRVPDRLDPFSREAYDTLEERYRRRGRHDLFSAITAPKHLRVKNFVVDVGDGIGVLHAEDDGSPKERLVGSWMPSMLQQLDSRGRKNPQAFSYDGVLSQGNGLLTIVEDAAHHADLLQRLLNVPDERSVKLDKGVAMDVDSQLLIISNPDLEAVLNQHAERGGTDPLKALKRRLDKQTFRYLTNISLEAQLIRRELTNERSVWDHASYDELEERIEAGVTVSVRQRDDHHVDREFAPHAIEAAALYSVATRLDAEDLPGDLDIVDKAVLFDKGYLEVGDERHEKDEFSFSSDATDGRYGIPVTYTRDVLASLLQEERDRHHPSMPVESVLMPRDVLDAMVADLQDAPVFSASERTEFESRRRPVESAILERQTSDVLEALLYDERVDESTTETYIEHVYAWATDEELTNPRGEPESPDSLLMKVFETDHLGRFTDADYDENEPSRDVEAFRRDRIIAAINRHAWEQRSADFTVDDVSLRDIPVIRRVLESLDWDDVRRTFEDFDPAQWMDPPENTETERLKTTTNDRLVEHFGYTPASAALTSQRVMAEVRSQWG